MFVQEAWQICRLFFHVTYAHEKDPKTMVDAVRDIATARVGSLTLQVPLKLPLPDERGKAQFPVASGTIHWTRSRS